VPEDRETVFVAGRQNGGGGTRKKHTAEDCPALEKAQTVIQRPRDVYPDDIEWCRYCTDDIERSGPQDHSHYNALAAAADTEGDSA
jgi:hypothetical protein